MGLGRYSVTEAIVIERPRDVVFDFVGDPENDPRCRLVPSVTFTGDRQTGLGSYEFGQVLGPRTIPASGEIVERSRPAFLRSRSSFDTASLESTYLDDSGGGTRLVNTNHVRWAGPIRFLHPYLKRNTGKNMARQLADLKALLESPV